MRTYESDRGRAGDIKAKSVYYESQRRRAAFSLIELVFAIAILSMVGAAYVLVNNFCSNIYARTMAVTASHVEARSGIERLLKEIHSNIAGPQPVQVEVKHGKRVLKDAFGDAAQGFALQMRVGGPFQVVSDTSKGGTTITVDVGGAGIVPTPNQMILVPSYGIEKFIASVGTPNGTRYPITVQDADGFNAAEVVTLDDNGQAGYDGRGARRGFVQAYFTTPVVYIAENGQLLRYRVAHDATLGLPVLSGNAEVVADGLDANDPDDPDDPFKPFELDAGDGSDLRGPDSRSIAVVRLFTKDKRTDRLGYTATNMFLQAMIPTRYQLATRPTVRVANSENN